MAIEHPLGVIPLDAPGDYGHGGHRFYGEIAHSALIGEHHGIGAIKDGVGYIAHLGPGGPGAAHHRIEHLGGCDHRDAETVGLANQLLLQQGNFFGGHLNSQVAPSHHHPVAEGQDVVDLIDGLKLFDLGHHGGFVAMAADQFADLAHVRGVAHKAEGHPINPLLQPKGQINAVFLGEGTDRELHIREIDPLVVREHSTNGDAAEQGLLGLVDAVDHHLHPTVIQQDATAWHHLIGQACVGDGGNLLIAGHIPRCEGELIALGQGDRPIGKAAQTNFGTLQVLKDAELNAQLR